MKDNEKSTSSAIILSKEGNKNTVTTIAESAEVHGSKRNTAASSQMQLLALAKKFVLDGGLVSVDKQVPIEDRIHKRARIGALRKQQNLEVIIQKSLSYCSSSEVINKADPDWFNTFTQLAEDVSNKTMQELWAKILAAEIAQPGSFSTKTLKVFREMSITDAKLLAKACSLAVSDHAKRNIRIISGAYQMPSLFNFFNKQREQSIPLSQFSLNYADLLVLADNHLVFVQETESSPMDKLEAFHFTFNGSPLTFSAKKANCLLQFYKFTPIGSELARLISDSGNSDYLQHLKSALSENFSIVEG